MGYTALFALFLFVGYLYLMAKENLSNAESELKRKEAIIDRYKESEQKLFKEQNDAYRKGKEDFAFVIKSQVLMTQAKGLYSRYDPDELCRMIIDNDYIIGVRGIQDIDFKHFEKTIKAALYAEKGYLTWYQKDCEDKIVNVRVDDRGRHIPLTDEELIKMRNHDFEFIFESIALK